MHVMAVILCFFVPLVSELYRDKVMVCFTLCSVQKTARQTAEFITFLTVK